VERALRLLLERPAGVPRELARAMRYGVLGPGKSLRRLLVLAGAEACGGSASRALPLACAAELIHAYSLVHDDLPAMDDADLRRGRPTSHRVFGEATAILAGDALQTYAFQLMADQDKIGVSPSIILQAIHEMAVAVGARGTVGGQVVDLESEGKEIDEKTIEYIHTRKTGEMIKASIRCGALIGGCEGEKLEAMTRFGDQIGLAFQIVDDILDIVGLEEDLGKDIGSDLEKKKATYPSVLGMEESRKTASALVESALKQLSSFDERAEPLRAIAEFFLARTN